MTDRLSERKCNASLVSRAILKRALNDMATAYALEDDAWRTRAYSRASALTDAANHSSGAFILDLDHPQETYGIGNSIADVIRRICTGGEDAARTILEKTVDTKKLRAFRLFRGVLGIGDKRAVQLARAGFTSLDQLRQNSAKLGLTRDVYAYGIAYYDDLNSRIPRKDAHNIISTIAAALNPRGVQQRTTYVLPLGSYRRGKSTVGDIDLLIDDPKHNDAGDVSRRLAASLGPDAFLLSVSRGTKRASFLMRYPSYAADAQQKRQQKPRANAGGSRRTRVCRVDLFVTDNASEKAAYVLHATGSATFNEYLRQVARAQGKKLNEYGLYDFNTNKPINIKTEHDIFHALGLPYIAPEKRELTPRQSV